MEIHVRSLHKSNTILTQRGLPGSVERAPVQVQGGRAVRGEALLRALLLKVANSFLAKHVWCNFKG